MSSRKKILWLTSWYPNKLAPFEGDFIQRHARAVAKLHDVELIFVKKDEEGRLTKEHLEEVNYSVPGLTERIIYYNPVRTLFPVTNKIFSDTAYKYFYKKAILRDFERSGKPSLVHLHVAMKAGMLALWLKEKYDLPFILSEHWTGYLKEAIPNLKDESLFVNRRRKKIIESATKVTAVSKLLADAISSRFKIAEPLIIPNVVDTEIFFPAERSKHTKTKFIHISSLEDQKDPFEMLKAFSILKKEAFQFSLTIYGPHNEAVENFAREAGLIEDIIFKAEVPQASLSQDLRMHDALVLFSKYETFGCVVIEANASGLPAILSDLPVFKEYISEGKNGLFAKQGNAESLAEALKKFINGFKFSSPVDISKLTYEKFSYNSVAQQFDDLYKNI